MNSNFAFLEEKWPLLASLGSTAEKYIYNDSNSCLMKLGLFGESVVHLMIMLDNISKPQEDNTHANRIKILKNEGLLPKDIDDILYALRISRNKAAHDGFESTEQAKILIELAYKLGIWFMQTYGDWNFEPVEFVIPRDTSNEIDFKAIVKAQEEKIKELTEKIETTSTAGTAVTTAERRKRANESADKVKLSEKETRYIIDEQLRKVGWEADTINLRYSKGTRPQKGRSIAIAEWPTDSTVGDRGAVDYALFAGTQLIGVVEAKRYYTDIPSVIDYQCKDYARMIKSEHAAYVISKWGDYQVPFLFATNGRKYLKQLEIKSGIWFLDARKSVNIPKAQQGWASPSGLIELLKKDLDKANEELMDTGYELLSDNDGLNLRPYQISAVKSAEQAVLEGRQTVLLSMATGTGKTRTVLGIIYRFLKSGQPCIIFG